MNINLDEFKNYLEKEERSKNTIRTYLYGLSLFFEKYDEVTTETVLEYKEWLKNSFKPRTANLRICGVIQYSKFIGKPVYVKNLKLQKTLSVENVITVEEFEKLLSGLKKDNDLRGYWMVMFLAKTGARVSEFVRFTKSSLQKGYEDLFSKGKARRIFFPQILIDESRAYFETVHGDYLFPSLCQRKLKNKAKTAITNHGVLSRLYVYAKRYGIRREVMHPHGFRHFFAKEFLKNGGDITLLSDVLGHEDIETTAIYTKVTLKEMSEKLSSLMGGEQKKPPEQRETGLQNDIIKLQGELIKSQQQVIELKNKLMEMGAS